MAAPSLTSLGDARALCPRASWSDDRTRLQALGQASRDTEFDPQHHQRQPPRRFGEGTRQRKATAGVLPDARRIPATDDDEKPV